MDEAEYSELVRAAYEGRVIISVDRIFARRLYTSGEGIDIIENEEAGTSGWWAGRWGNLAVPVEPYFGGYC